MKKWNCMHVVAGMAVLCNCHVVAQQAPATESRQDYSGSSFPGWIDCRAEVMQRWTLLSVNPQADLVTAGISKSTLDDEFVIFSGPASQISTALNFEIDGSLEAYVIDAKNGVEVTSEATVSVEVRILNQTFPGELKHTSSGSANGNSNVVNATGLLASFHGGMMKVKTPGLSVPVGQTLPFRLGLGDHTSVDLRINQPSPDVSLWAYAKAGHTISLPTQGPVFDLPSGFTANSIRVQLVGDHIETRSGSINDNRYAPRLEIVKTDNALSVTWPGKPGDFVLESAPTLVPPVRWATETDVLADNGKCVHTINLTTPYRFYRLRK